MMHVVVLVVFGGACWFLSMILKLPLMVQPAMARLASVPPGQTVPGLPAFTRLCMAAGPVLLAALSLLVGVKGLIHARVAWLQHTVVWESPGRGAPRIWMDPRQAAVFWSLIILLGFAWLAVTIHQRRTRE